MPFGHEPHMPGDGVFNAVEDLVEYTSLANQPFSDCQAVSKTYNVFNKTCRFVQAITEWNRRPNNEKTMANLKLHFRSAQSELRESSGPTLSDSDLDHRANLVREVVEGVQQAIMPALEEDPTSDILQQVGNSASQSTSTQQLLVQQLQGMQTMMSSMQSQLAAVSAVQNIQPFQGHGGVGRGGAGRGGRGG